MEMCFGYFHPGEPDIPHMRNPSGVSPLPSWEINFWQKKPILVTSLIKDSFQLVSSSFYTQTVPTRQYPFCQCMLITDNSPSVLMEGSNHTIFLILLDKACGEHSSAQNIITSAFRVPITYIARQLKLSLAGKTRFRDTTRL